MGIELQELDQQISSTTAQLDKVKTQRAKNLLQRDLQQQQAQAAGEENNMDSAALAASEALEEQLKNQIDELTRQQNTQVLSSETLAQIIKKDSLENEKELFDENLCKLWTKYHSSHEKLARMESFI